jgi:hypothetical protein
VLQQSEPAGEHLLLIFIVNALIFVEHESPFVLAVTIWRLIGLCLSLGT